MCERERERERGGVCTCVCVCVRERERERERCGVCVCVCVRERERERERERCVCVRARERKQETGDKTNERKCNTEQADPNEARRSEGRERERGGGRSSIKTRLTGSNETPSTQRISLAFGYNINERKLAGPQYLKRLTQSPRATEMKYHCKK